MGEGRRGGSTQRAQRRSGGIPYDWVGIYGGIPRLRDATRAVRAQTEASRPSARNDTFGVDLDRLREAIGWWRRRWRGAAAGSRATGGPARLRVPRDRA